MTEIGSSKDSLLVCCSSEELYRLLVLADYDGRKSTQELHQRQGSEQSLNLEDIFDGTAGSRCVSTGPLPKRTLPRSQTMPRESATSCDVQLLGFSNGNNDTGGIEYYEESNEITTHGNTAPTIAKEQTKPSMNPPKILSRTNVAGSPGQPPVAMVNRRK